MARFEEIARVTTRGAGLDTIGDGSERSNSRLVHQAITTDVLNSPDEPTILRRTDLDGSLVEGYVWFGAMAQIVEALWPVESKVKDPVSQQGMGVLINKYLRTTNNAVCIERHGKDRPPKWWIRKTWNDAPPPGSSALKGITPTYAERRLTPQEAGETRPVAPVEITHREPKPRVTQTVEPVKPVELTEAERVKTNEEKARARAAANDRVQLVRGRTSFAITEDGEAAPPEYPFACLTTDITGRRCRRVFSKQGQLSQHRNAGHGMMNRIIEAAAELLSRGRPVTGDTIADVIGGHQTTIYSYFETIDAVRAAGARLLDQRHLDAVPPPVPAAVEPPFTAVRPKPVPPSKSYEDDVDRSREIVQLIVGFCHVVGISVNSSALRQFPMPISYATRGKFFTDLINDGVVDLVDGKTASGNSVQVFIAGRSFDEKIARRLSVLLPENEGVILPVPAPATATRQELDVIGLLQLAMDGVRLMENTSAIAKRQDDELTRLASDRADALQLAQDAVDETLVMRTKLEREQEHTALLEKKLTHFRKVLDS